MKADIMNLAIEIPVVNTLEDIADDEIYAVNGFEHPIAAEKVTEYGKEELSGQVGGFFTGSDGVSRYYMETGKFIV